MLRAELSALGPVAVKIGQTLSQRPDILPEDVCEQLKGLQTSNEPFADSLAFQVTAEEFNATGLYLPYISLISLYLPISPYISPGDRRGVQCDRASRARLRRDPRLRSARPDALRQPEQDLHRLGLAWPGLPRHDARWERDRSQG